MNQLDKHQFEKLHPHKTKECSLTEGHSKVIVLEEAGSPHFGAIRCLYCAKFFGWAPKPREVADTSAYPKASAPTIVIKCLGVDNWVMNGSWDEKHESKIGPMRAVLTHAYNWAKEQDTIYTEGIGKKHEYITTI